MLNMPLIFFWSCNFQIIVPLWPLYYLQPSLSPFLAPQEKPYRNLYNYIILETLKKLTTTVHFNYDKITLFYKFYRKLAVNFYYSSRNILTNCFTTIMTWWIFEKRKLFSFSRLSKVKYFRIIITIADNSRLGRRQFLNV